MPAQRKPSLETISEGWQEVAPSSSSAATPVSEQDASSSSSDSESECPTTVHIEDIAARSGSPSEDTVDSGASLSGIGGSSMPTSVSGAASTVSRADSPGGTSTSDNDNVSRSVPVTSSMRIFRVSTAQLSWPVSEAEARSSSAAAGNEAGPNSSAAEDEAGSLSSPISDSSSSSSSSDDSFTSTSESTSIPGVHVFPLSPAQGIAGRPGSPVPEMLANPGPSAAATRLAPTNDGALLSTFPTSGGINLLPHRPPPHFNRSGSSRPQPTFLSPAAREALVRQRDYFRNLGRPTPFDSDDGGVFAQRRAEEARLARQGYTPRDINPHPLRSHPVDPPCTRCTGLPSTQRPRLCLNCQDFFGEQIRREGLTSPYDNSETRSPSPNYDPIFPAPQRHTICRVINHTVDPVRTEVHVLNNANTHGTGNDGIGRAVDAAEGAYQGQDARTGVPSGNGTSANAGPNYEAYDEPTRSLLQSGIPIAAMLAFSDSEVGDGSVGDGDGEENES